jgi:DNA polymerase I-like protein with 3'-5' exonuclease and polymerase domains
VTDIPFREVVTADFEFRIEPGGRPFIRCVVFRYWPSGRELRLWRDQLLAMPHPPFDIERNLFVAFYAPAEIGCFLELGWSTPENIIDLFVEHRVLTNGILPKPERKKTNSMSGKVQRGIGRDSLLNALAIRGLGHLDVDTKEEMRELAMTTDELTPQQQADLLDYCANDVIGAEALFRYMLERNQIDWLRALWRGRYTIAAARSERLGIPIDMSLFRRLTENWSTLKHELIASINQIFDVFDEHDTFKTDKFVRNVIIRFGLPWPKLPSGAFALDNDTFDDMARFHPELRPLYEVRSSLGELRLTGLSIGPDGRNRCMLSIFQTVTGRNAPSNSAFIYGPARWMRSLIMPRPGFALASVDWRTQEVAIAAAQSGDEKLLAAYQSGDVYAAFAWDAGIMPRGTIDKEIRQICKTIVLGIQYLMGPESIAYRAGISVREARHFLALHRRTYKKFWQWAEDTIATALFTSVMTTRYGWRRGILADPNVRSIQNWPIQSHGAEMMRAVMIAATEAGLRICAPIHDAFLLEAPIKRIEEDTAALQSIMRAAGTAVVGVPIETDAKIIRPPERYVDDRGVAMWNKVMGLLEAIERKKDAA